MERWLGNGDLPAFTGFTAPEIINLYTDFIVPGMRILVGYGIRTGIAVGVVDTGILSVAESPANPAGLTIIIMIRKRAESHGQWCGCDTR